MKKITLICLMAFLVCLLSACEPVKPVADSGNSSSSSNNDSDSEKKDNENPADNKAGETSDSDVKNDNNENKNENKMPVKLGVIRKTDSDYKWSNKYEMMLASMKYQTVSLNPETEKEYPALSETLKKENADKKSDFEKEYKNLVRAAKSDIKDMSGMFIRHEYTDKTSVRRADAAVFSVLSDVYYYTGGEHGSYSLIGYNYDSQTGKKLELNDVVSDREAFAGYVEDEFNKFWKKADLFDGTSVKDFVADEENDVSWTVDYYGITVYFNPYDVAPYATGIQTVNVSFKDHPELFMEKYMNVPDSYITELVMNIPSYIDLNGDGRKNKLMITGYKDENDYYNSEKIKVDKKTAKDDAYAYMVQPKLVKTKDGKYYIYNEATGDNDYTRITIFDICSGKIKKTGVFDGGECDIIGDEPMEYYGNDVITNPDNMKLATRTNHMSSISGYKNYSAGEDGVPVSPDKVYYMDYEMIFTVKIPIKADEADSNTLEETGQKITLNKGDKVVYYATDNKRYGYLKNDSGKIVRVKTKKRDWEQYIGEKTIMDIFDGIIYAG